METGTTFSTTLGNNATDVMSCIDINACPMYSTVIYRPRGTDGLDGTRPTLSSSAVPETNIGMLLAIGLSCILLSRLLRK